jgi:lambda family phage portal protein
MNLVDGLVSYFNPNAGLKRQVARHQLSSVRKFEGASRGTSRTRNWHTDGRGPNSEIMNDLYILRNRSRDLVKNSPIARRIKDVIVGNVVGHGIIPQSKIKRIDELFKNWGDTREIDADGLHNYYGMQALAMGTLVDAGEVFIRKIRRDSKDKLSVPLQYQIIEPDYVDHLKTETTKDGEQIIMGVHFDKSGRRKGFWVFENHPGEYYLGNSFSYQSKFVSADEMEQVFRVDRPNQVRGVPWLHPVMMKIKDLSDLSDAEIVRHKIATFFAAFVYDSDGEVGGETDVNGNPVPSELATGLMPGTIETLPLGKDIKFSNPPVPENYASVIQTHLKEIAAGVGITYEALTGDLSQTNFSSARMGRLEFQKQIDQWRNFILIPMFCNPIMKGFSDACALKSGEEFSEKSFTHTAPRKEFVDPEKETRAIKNAVRDGFLSFPEAIRQYGFDPEDVIQENDDFFKILDQKKHIYDSDPRRVSGAGNLNELERGEDAE